MVAIGIPIPPRRARIRGINQSKARVPLPSTPSARAAMTPVTRVKACPAKDVPRVSAPGPLVIRAHPASLSGSFTTGNGSREPLVWGIACVGNVVSVQGVTQLPVLLVAYRRPGTTARVIDAIREVRPPRIYFAVDGPVPGRADAADDVRAVQELVSEFDWGCTVRTLFRDENLGCARGVSGAISWFFENEEAGVILEDDCVPEAAFFRYCGEALEKYREDPRVMHVSGHANFHLEDPDASYFMSRYAQVWGWATWRHAWDAFAMDLDGSVEIEDVLSQFPTERERKYWQPVMERTFGGRIDSWAYRWAFAIWRSGGVSLYPTTNMVENIRFDFKSTHTRPWSSSRWSSPASTSPGELTSPTTTSVDEEQDTVVFDHAYAKPALPVRVWRAARSITLSQTKS